MKRSKNDKFEIPTKDPYGNSFSPVLAAQRLILGFAAHKFMELLKPQELYYSFEENDNQVISTMVYNEIPYEDAIGPAIWVWNRINPHHVNFYDYEYINTTLHFILDGEEETDLTDTTKLVSMKVDGIKNNIIIPKVIDNKTPESVRAIYIKPNEGIIEFVVDKDMNMYDPFDLSIYKIRKKV